MVTRSSRTPWRSLRIHTLGHSTRPLEELIALLRSFDVSVLADVRTIARSRHNPQFNEDTLRAALRPHGIRYVRIPELGGLRRAAPDSPNTGWRNTSFRGYADHMSSAEFEAGLAQLQALAESGGIALMCAEALPWRCHRSLIADALTVRGATVKHIMNAKTANPHRLTPFARVEGTRLTYPGEDAVRRAPASRRARSGAPGRAARAASDRASGRSSGRSSSRPPESAR